MSLLREKYVVITSKYDVLMRKDLIITRKYVVLTRKDLVITRKYVVLKNDISQLRFNLSREER